MSEERKEYYKRYRQTDKYKQYQKEYKKRYKIENREKILEEKRRYYKNIKIGRNVLKELEEWLKEENTYSDYKDVTYRETMGYVLDKIQELKEKYK